MRHIIRIIFALLFSFATAEAAEKVLKADFRHRPPEMIVEGERFVGPLKDILEEAAKSPGYGVEWRVAPFPRSLNNLRQGQIDIIPRTIRNDDREAFINFLGPIGYQDKDIVFLVRKGKESSIGQYKDLEKLTIGAKLKTAYFKRFDHDTTLDKEMATDDFKLARMFIGDRFDTVVVLDKAAMESALAGLKFDDYRYADYRFEQKVGNFYGMSKTSPNAGLFSPLDAKLDEMMTSGRVAEIYARFGVAPPQQ